VLCSTILLNERAGETEMELPAIMGAEATLNGFFAAVSHPTRR